LKLNQLHQQWLQNKTVDQLPKSRHFEIMGGWNIACLNLTTQFL
jgi:hypothetical protein